MMDDFQSLSKGVFVIPYEQLEPVEGPHTPSEHAGPSSLRRPLKRHYDEAYERWVAAHEAYEAERTDQHIEDIADWLEGCSAPTTLKFGFDTHRLPVGIIQDTSPQLTGLLSEVVNHVVVIQGRDMDLGSMSRAIALGLVGESVVSKNGRSGMDYVESWWKALPVPRRTPILIYVPHAQLVPTSTLSELIYILSLRPAPPIRLLLSVPSVSTFLGSLSHINPGGVAVDVLGLGSKRGKGDAVRALLEAASLSKSGIHVGPDLVEQLEEEQRIHGGGAASLHKSLKWRLLHHSVNSPLTTLCQNPTKAEEVEAVITGETENDGIRKLSQVDHHRDARATLNPAPRVSILHALSSNEAYTKRPRAIKVDASRPSEEGHTSPDDPSTATPRSVKRRKTNRIRSTPPVDSLESVNPNGEANAEERADLKELGVLFNLWRSAGRHVNLWDWLEGFRGNMMGAGQKESAQAEARGISIDLEDGGLQEGQKGNDGTPRAAQIARPQDIEMEQNDDGDEEKAARLHAAFVRFCEEARMMGLVRARGRTKRADEVVKSIALV